MSGHRPVFKITVKFIWGLKVNASNNCLLPVLWMYERKKPTKRGIVEFVERIELPSWILQSHFSTAPCSDWMEQSLHCSVRWMKMQRVNFLSLNVEGFYIAHRVNGTTVSLSHSLDWLSIYLQSPGPAEVWAACCITKQLMQRVDGGHLQWIRPNVFPITHTVKGEGGLNSLTVCVKAHDCKSCVMLLFSLVNKNMITFFLSVEKWFRVLFCVSV